VKKKLFSYSKGNGGWKEENKMIHSPITKNMEVGGK